MFMKKLGFGLMRLPQLDKDDYGSVDIERVKKMADAFMENGFTYFDTAAPYHRGNSEVAFREAVAKRYPRTSYTITDKLSLFMIRNAEEMEGFFESQLERLGVDYMDYYWLHGLGGPSFKQAEEWHAFEFVQRKKAEGKVKHIGLSFHDKAELLDEILTKHRKPVIVMEPIKGGSLVNIPQEAEKLYQDYRPDSSVASWAIRFAASPDNVMMVLSGMSDEEQMWDNISYMKEFHPLDEEEQKIVEQATKIIKASIAIPCTACRYCIDDCPKKIAIPDYFAVYNNLKRFGGPQGMVASTYYRNLAQTHGKASDCLKCGKCEKRCPQHLPIREYLEAVAEELE